MVWASDDNDGLMYVPEVREIGDRVTQAESDALVYAFIQRLKEMC